MVTADHDDPRALLLQPDVRSIIWVLVLRLAKPQPLGTELLLFVCLDDFVLRLQPSAECVRRDLVHPGSQRLSVTLLTCRRFHDKERSKSLLPDVLVRTLAMT